jgi:hypothetical protein
MDQRVVEINVPMSTGLPVVVEPFPELIAPIAKDGAGW